MLVIEGWGKYNRYFYTPVCKTFYLNEINDDEFQSRVFFSNADDIYINCFETQNYLNKIGSNNSSRIYFYKLDKKGKILEKTYTLISEKEWNFYVRHKIFLFLSDFLFLRARQVKYKNSVEYLLLEDSGLKKIKEKINLNDDFLYELIEKENNGDNTYKFPWERQDLIEIELSITEPQEIKIELEPTWEENEIISYFKTNNELIKNLLEKFLLFKIDQSRWRYI